MSSSLFEYIEWPSIPLPSSLFALYYTGGHVLKCRGILSHLSTNIYPVALFPSSVSGCLPFFSRGMSRPKSFGSKKVIMAPPRVLFWPLSKGACPPRTLWPAVDLRDVLPLPIYTILFQFRNTRSFFPLISLVSSPVFPACSSIRSVHFISVVCRLPSIKILLFHPTPAFLSTLYPFRGISQT